MHSSPQTRGEERLLVKLHFIESPLSAISMHICQCVSREILANMIRFLLVSQSFVVNCCSLGLLSVELKNKHFI